MATPSKAEILQASRERERRRRQKALVAGLVIIILIVGGFFSLLNLDFLRVTKIQILGETSADPEVVRSFVADDLLAGHYLWLVPKNSVFFVSKGQLIELLKKRFLGLATVTITWPDLNTLAIQVTDRETKILWCVGQEPKKQCFFLSPMGVPYQSAPSFSDSLYVELHSSATTTDLTKPVIDPKKLNRVNNFLSYLRSSLPSWPSRGLSLSSVEVESQNDFSAILLKPSEPNWQGRVFFSTDQTSNNLITNLHSVLKNSDFKTDWVDNNSQLDYLDLRFPGKVFYKFK